jgi:5-methylcytosine-specific restriction endonuclease McrA
MKIIKTIKHILKSKDQHFISVDDDVYKRWKLLIKLAVKLNKRYKSCEIYRKKFKNIENFVVIGLKYSGKNVKRRTSGFAKEFVQSNKSSKCIYCKTKLTPENATADHIVPISNGGNNSQVNLIVCCDKCNSDRGNSNFYDYLKLKNKSYKNIKVIYI